MQSGVKSATEGYRLPTFTTSRPREQPGFRPAGLDRCAPHERQRWEEDNYRFPPYQYRDHNLVWTRKGAARRPNVQEKEAIMCIPVGYTRPCLPKNQQGSTAWEDTRLTLIGNSWHVGVITWLLEQLLGPLGFCRRQVSRSPRSGKLPDARTQWNFAGNPPSPTRVVKQNVG